VAHKGERKAIYRILAGKPLGRRPRCRWEDNIKTDLQEVGCSAMGWFELAQDRDG